MTDEQPKPKEPDYTELKKFRDWFLANWRNAVISMVLGAVVYALVRR